MCYSRDTELWKLSLGENVLFSLERTTGFARRTDRAKRIHSTGLKVVIMVELERNETLFDSEPRMMSPKIDEGTNINK